MKKWLLLSAICLFAASAYSLDIKPYVEGKISESWASVKSKDDSASVTLRDGMVQGGTLELGAKLSQFRVGLEGYVNDEARDNLNLSTGLFSMSIPIMFESKGFFLNAYWDIPFLSEKWEKVKPYVGAGVGYSWLKLSTFGQRASDKDCGWNIGLGVAYELNNRFDLVLGYRYEDLGKLKDEDATTKFKNHKVSFGVRYSL